MMIYNYGYDVDIPNIEPKKKRGIRILKRQGKDNFASHKILAGLVCLPLFGECLLNYW